MIYYFSGTGNSAWVAKEIAAGLGLQAVNLAAPQSYGRLRQPRSRQEALTASAATTSDEPAPESNFVGIVCPIYAWGIPAIVEKFARNQSFPSSAFCFAVATCGDDAGKALQRFRRFFPAQSLYSVQMPNNYIPMFRVDEPAEEERKVIAAHAQLSRIIADLKARQPVVAVHEGSLATLKTAWVSPLFNRFAKKTRNFKVNTSCIRCGKCGRECPSRAIRFGVDGLPIWQKKTCELCLRCLHLCPVEAIDKGRGTVGKTRYRFGKNVPLDLYQSTSAADSSQPNVSPTSSAELPAD